MGDSVGFYNWSFSIISSKIQGNTKKVVKVYAKTIASDLVSVKPMNEPSGICFNTDMLIPKWTKQHRYIQLIENDIK